MGYGTTKVLAGGALLWVIVTLSAMSLADAVGPPPKTCPPGAWGRTTHYGPHCAPYTCTADSDCKKGQRCRPHALCVTDKTYEHWRGNTHVVRVTGQCAETDSCSDGGECRKASYCMPTAPTPPPVSARPSAGPAAPTTGAAPSNPPVTTSPSKGCGACVTAFVAPGQARPLPALIALVALVLLRRRGRYG